MICSLVGPDAVRDCVGLPRDGEGNFSQNGPGLVAYSVNTAKHTISAEVTLAGARPHETYVVRLIQSDGSDCLKENGSLVTSAGGAGTFNVTEAIDPGATSATIVIDTGALFGVPTYGSPENFQF
jgi:hypothetical protein